MKWKVTQEFGGGKFHKGDVINDTDQIDFTFWQYVQDKAKEGAVVPYTEGAMKAPKNKAINAAPEVKSSDIKIND